MTRFDSKLLKEDDPKAYMEYKLITENPKYRKSTNVVKITY